MRYALVIITASMLLLAIFAGKPSRNDFERELSAMLREVVAQGSYDRNKDVVSNAIAIGCRWRTDECVRIIRKMYEVSTTDYILFTRHDVEGPGATISCWGVFRQFICQSELSVPTIETALRKYR